MGERLSWIIQEGASSSERDFPVGLALPTLCGRRASWAFTEFRPQRRGPSTPSASLGVPARLPNPSAKNAEWMGPAKAARERGADLCALAYDRRADERLCPLKAAEPIPRLRDQSLNSASGQPCSSSDGGSSIVFGFRACTLRKQRAAKDMYCAGELVRA